ncbi:unnamed protein product [Staurois parvus]|uniref:Uncharacterized protein n=1 Tax=Staurois parvus TaxID=386267 RepID=A0ABN9FEZ3_9NEOB|nr:unnamed protein product [Staurois parvus]
MFTRAPDSGDGLGADRNQVAAPEYTCLRQRNPPEVYAGGEPNVKRQKAEAGMARSVQDGWMDEWW